MLARVMVDVRRPEEAHLVVDAVEPVVAEVLGEEEQQPGPAGPCRGRTARHCVGAEEAARAAPLVAAPTTTTLPSPIARLAQRVARSRTPARPAAARAGEPVLEQQQRDEHGRRVGDQVRTRALALQLGAHASRSSQAKLRRAASGSPWTSPPSAAPWSAAITPSTMASKSGFARGRAREQLARFAQQVRVVAGEHRRELGAQHRIRTRRRVELERRRAGARSPNVRTSCAQRGAEAVARRGGLGEGARKSSISAANKRSAVAPTSPALLENA